MQSGKGSFREGGKKGGGREVVGILGARGMTDCLRVLAALQGNTSLTRVIPSIDRPAHSHLQFQFQGIYHLLASEHQECLWYTCMQAKPPYT